MMFSKKKFHRDRDSSYHIYRDILRKYFIYSGLFWVFLSLLFLLGLISLETWPHPAQGFFHSFGLQVKNLGFVFLVLIVSSIVGAILSLPAVLVRMALQGKIDKIQTRFLPQPIRKFFLKTFIPYVLIFVFHGSFLFLNFAFSIPKVSSFSDREGLFYKAISKVHSVFFRISDEKLTSIWKPPEGKKFVFALPESLLRNAQGFPNLIALLGQPIPVISSLATKEALITRMSLGSHFNITLPSLYAPLPIQKCDQVSPLGKTFIGVQPYDTAFLPRILKSNYVLPSEIKNINLKTIFRNRVLLSQIHLSWLFATPLGGLLSRGEWVRPHFNALNRELLWSYAKKMKADIDTYIFLLPENEYGVSYAPSLLLRYEWPKKWVQDEYRRFFEELDGLLAKLIKQTKGKIFIVPYPDLNDVLPHSYFFSNESLSAPSFWTSYAIGERVQEERFPSRCEPFYARRDTLADVGKNLDQRIRSTKELAHMFPFLPNSFMHSVYNQLDRGVLCREGKKMFLFILKEASFLEARNLYSPDIFELLKAKKEQGLEPYEFFKVYSTEQNGLQVLDDIEQIKKLFSLFSTDIKLNLTKLFD